MRTQGGMEAGIIKGARRSGAYEANPAPTTRTKGGRTHIDHALQLIAKDVHAAAFADDAASFLRAVDRLRRECARVLEKADE